MATVVFKSRIDWWIWAVLAFSLVVILSAKSET